MMAIFIEMTVMMTCMPLHDGMVTAHPTHAHFVDAAPVETLNDADWSARIVQAKGTGRPPRKYKGARAKLMARRAAEVIAVRNLARKMNRRGGRLRGFRYVEYHYHSDGRVTAVVEARQQ
ncbi:MAG: hypothetical protein ACPGXK_11750 [Phycisphaerae bacterium]